MLINTSRPCNCSFLCLFLFNQHHGSKILLLWEDLASSSHQTSPTIAFPDAPLRGLNSAGRRLTQTRDALRLDDEWLDSGFFSNNKKSKCSTPKSPSTSKSLNSPSRLSESPALKFPESIEVGKPVQKVDAIPVRYGEPPLAQRVDSEVQQKPSTSARFRSRIPRLQKVFFIISIIVVGLLVAKKPMLAYFHL